MTRKHFEALANALAFARPWGDLDKGDTRDQWQRDVQAVADVCRANNPRFDREKFVHACETRFSA